MSLSPVAALSYGPGARHPGPHEADVSVRLLRQNHPRAGLPCPATRTACCAGGAVGATHRVRRERSTQLRRKLHDPRECRRRHGAGERRRARRGRRGAGRSWRAGYPRIPLGRQIPVAYSRAAP
ncbi:hypothetical protein CU044_1187 [Streptomyces sp. L-9-10]|nr:hypothetical protein CU044_1187 [Streptomyces sp. L-9-10]